MLHTINSTCTVWLECQVSTFSRIHCGLDEVEDYPQRIRAVCLTTTAEGREGIDGAPPGFVDDRVISEYNSYLQPSGE